MFSSSVFQIGLCVFLLSASIIKHHNALCIYCCILWGLRVSLVDKTFPNATRFFYLVLYRLVHPTQICPYQSYDVNSLWAAKQLGPNLMQCQCRCGVKIQLFLPGFIESLLRVASHWTALICQAFRSGRLAKLPQVRFSILTEVSVRVRFHKGDCDA